MLTNHTTASPMVEELFRQIVAVVGEDPPSLPASRVDQSVNEVVFEIMIEGVRYTLTRTFTRLPNGQVGLSPREKEIVRLVAKGLANKAIAAVLDVSPWTVSTHLRRVYSKLRVNSRAEMIARVMERGLLEPNGE